MIVERLSVAAVCRLPSLLCTKNDFKEKVQKYTFFTIFPRNGLYDSVVLWMYFVCTLGVLRAQGDAYRKRLRDAALYTFVYHYTFAAKSKTLII